MSQEIITTQELSAQFKKPRVCEDGHDKVIYDADFFGGPGERSCPICEKLKSIQGEKVSLSAQKINDLRSVIRELRSAKDEIDDIEGKIEEIIG